MAKIGLRYPVAAVVKTEAEGAITYDTGFIIGRAVSANKTLNSNDNPLYADDAIAESDTSFADGTLELGVDDFGSTIEDTLEITAKLLGHTVEEEDGVKVIKKSADDNAAAVGVGYIKTKKMRNQDMYEATWLYKVKFQLPSENSTTKGQSVEWQTQTITGRIMAASVLNNNYEKTAMFETESEAKAWLNKLANIGGTI